MPATGKDDPGTCPDLAGQPWCVPNLGPVAHGILKFLTGSALNGRLTVCEQRRDRMPTENSVRLDGHSVMRAERMLASGDWPRVRIARLNGEPFAISRDREQLRAFRVALWAQAGDSAEGAEINIS